MLPEIRSKEYLYPIPEYNLKQRDIENFIHELRGFHELFEDCFNRTRIFHQSPFKIAKRLVKRCWPSSTYWM